MAEATGIFINFNIEEIQLKKWYYSKQHYFDNIDLTDPRMVRTPFLYQKVTVFFNSNSKIVNNYVFFVI